MPQSFEMRPSASEAAPRSIWPLLGALRFGFAAWVLAAHTYNFGLESRALPVPSRSGLMAVICFFAISGFSIHHSIAAQSDGYLRRRALRILPTHVFTVIASLIAYLVLGPTLLGLHEIPYPMPTWLKWLGYLLLLNVYFAPNFIMMLFPLWSLSIEAAYYVFAPAIRRLRRTMLLCIVALSGLSMMIWPRFAGTDYTLTPYGTEILTFAWAWLTGWLAYRHPRDKLGFAICALVGCGVCLTHPTDLWMVNWRVQAFTYAIWVATTAVLFLPPDLTMSQAVRRTCLYLGDLSFPLYVTHYPVLFIMTTAVWHTHPGLNHGLVQAGLSLLVAHLVLVLIDRPMRGTRAAVPGYVPATAA